MIRSTQQAWQIYHLDQFKESENFDLIESHQPSEPENRKNLQTKPKRKAEIKNLRQVPTVNKSNEEIVQTVRISTVNARSLKHKENLISEEIHNTNSDITIITETWLKTLMKMTSGHTHQN